MDGERKKSTRPNQCRRRKTVPGFYPQTLIMTMSGYEVRMHTGRGAKYICACDEVVAGKRRESHIA
ncbi:hypothetical protein CHS0354_022467, partial [Potamilus streckersoni]